MLLYKSNILEVNYLEVQYLIHLTFKKTAQNQNIETLQQELLTFLEKRVKRRGRYIFLDLRNTENLANKEFIVWFAAKILPEIFSLKGKKFAILSNQKFQLPSYLMVKETLLETKVFISPQQAMEWLLKNAERRRLGLSGHRHKD